MVRSSTQLASTVVNSCCGDSPSVARASSGKRNRTHILLESVKLRPRILMGVPPVSVPHDGWTDSSTGALRTVNGIISVKSWPELSESCTRHREFGGSIAGVAHVMRAGSSTKPTISIACGRSLPNLSNSVGHFMLRSLSFLVGRAFTALDASLRNRTITLPRATKPVPETFI